MNGGTDGWTFSLFHRTLSPIGTAALAHFKGTAQLMNPFVDLRKNSGSLLMRTQLVRAFTKTKKVGFFEPQPAENFGYFPDAGTTFMCAARYFLLAKTKVFLLNAHAP